MGYFRFMLALAVCANHLWIIGGVGRYAVFSFYILSGYLMTTIILDKYGITRSGFYKYSINRLLRIYPTYLLAFAFTLLILFTLGTDNIRSIDSNISIPSGFKAWFMNASLINLDFNVKNRTIPPGWTLFVELFFYFFIPFAIKLGKRFITFWFLASVTYHIIIIITSNDAMLGWNERYGTLIAGSLGFSIGCYFKYNDFSWVKSKIVLLLAVISFFSCYFITAIWFLKSPTKHQFEVMSTIFFYLNIISSVVIISRLIDFKQNQFGELCGNLSFPFYLFHITIGYVIFKSTDIPPRSFSLFLAGIIVTFIISITTLAFDKRINIIRNRIRED
ncbi:acyltransferase family protein [Salmonella enterica]